MSDQPVTETPTPRTDALFRAPNGNYLYASASDYRYLARTLERELAAVKAERDADKARLDDIEYRWLSVQWNSRVQQWTVQEPGQVCGCISSASTLRAAIDQARKTKDMNEQEWRPIETAPMDGTRILVWGLHAYGVVIAFWNTFHGAPHWCWSGEMHDHVDTPTHWAPLPNPPTP